MFRRLAKFCLLWEMRFFYLFGRYRHLPERLLNLRAISLAERPYRNFSYRPLGLAPWQRPMRDSWNVLTCTVWMETWLAWDVNLVLFSWNWLVLPRSTSWRGFVGADCWPSAGKDPAEKARRAQDVARAGKWAGMIAFFQPCDHVENRFAFLFDRGWDRYLQQEVLV